MSEIAVPKNHQKKQQSENFLDFLSIKSDEENQKQFIGEHCVYLQYSEIFPSSHNNQKMDCKICQNNYTTRSHIPKVLGCGHTFCHKCLTYLVSNYSIICPNCRKKTLFLQGTDSQTAVSLLTTNFLVLENAPIYQDYNIANKHIPLQNKSHFKNIGENRERLAEAPNAFPANDVDPAFNVIFHQEPAAAPRSSCCVPILTFIFESIILIPKLIAYVSMNILIIILVEIIFKYENFPSKERIIDINRNFKSSFSTVTFFLSCSYTFYLFFWILKSLIGIMPYLSSFIHHFEAILSLIFKIHSVICLCGALLVYNADEKQMEEDSYRFTSVSVEIVAIYYIWVIISTFIRKIGKLFGVDLKY